MDTMDQAAGDKELWDRLREGDGQAFEGFYSANAGRLRNFLRRYLGDSKAAEDIAQEAFLELWNHPNGFNPERATLRTYLFGIAAKRAADWWRGHPAPEKALATEGRTASAESTLLISDALGRLEPEMRGLLWLREVEGYSYAEMAEILKIPVGTLKSRLFAAREHLRQIWKGPES